MKIIITWDEGIIKKVKKKISGNLLGISSTEGMGSAYLHYYHILTNSGKVFHIGETHNMNIEIIKDAKCTKNEVEG